MTRPADPSLYLDNYSEGYPSAGDLQGESEAAGGLDITLVKEEGGRFVVEARKVCDAPWASALAAHLGHLGMTVEVRAENEERKDAEEGNEEKGRKE